MSIARLQATDTSTIKWDRDDNSSESIVNGRKEMEVERESEWERERERVWERESNENEKKRHIQ